MFLSLKARLKSLESKLQPFTMGIFTVTLKDGSKKEMLWTDAAKAALDNEAAAVDGDESDNLLGLVRALMK
jgi:hypothetical protein